MRKSGKSKPTLNNAKAAPLPQDAALVGREHEIKTVQTLLQNKAVRLVTLTGPGGIGKTRLAMQVAASLVTNFEGVALVLLANVGESSLVTAAIAQALGITETTSTQTAQPPTQTLIENIKSYLLDKPMLLVLDNFEQVIEAAPVVSQLLANCPTLKVLATSRLSLQLSDEHEVSILPLTLPNLAQLPDLTTLSQYAALELFTQRAQAAKADFQLTEANAATVAAICVRLDGLPLAIELAAARLKLLPPQTLLERLVAPQGLHLNILANPVRDLATRQQTMRSSIEWSYNLLTPTEKTLLGRLGVFVGGWSLEAVEVICSDTERLLAANIIEELGQLVNHSLVVAEEQNKEAHFRLLEVIRQYSLDKLHENAANETATRQKHLGYYVKLVEAASTNLWLGLEQASTLAWLEIEYPNIRAALEWALPNSVEMGGRLATALDIFWDAFGYLSEGRRWLQLVLEHSAALSPAVLAKALNGAGWMAHRQGDFAAGIQLCTRSLAIYQQLQDESNIAIVLNNLGWIALCQNELEQATPLIEQSLALFSKLNIQHGLAACYTYLGLVALGQGETTKAEQLCNHSISLCRELGDGQSIGRAFTALAAVKLFQWQYTEAKSLLLNGLEQLQQLGDRLFITYNLVGLAVVALVEDEVAWAVHLFGAAEALRETVGTQLLPLLQIPYNLALDAAKSQFDTTSFERLWKEGRNLSVEAIQAQLLAKAAQNQPNQPQPELIVKAAPTENTKTKASPKNSKITPTWNLTTRETEVLQLLASGLTNAQIAQKLVLSTLTVNSYLRTIYSKIEVPSRSAATRFAIEHALV
jgi:predicted ATPase/DNA-binding CsgD family transcriptional regulator